MTPAAVRAARVTLGSRVGRDKISQHELAAMLRMGKNGWQSISRWEQDGNTIPGPAQIAIECLLNHGR